MSEVLTLYELNQLIQSVIDTALPQTFLVTAEIASFDIKKHCYITLVDKDEDTVKAEMKAVLWANRFKTLSAEFKAATGIELAKGLKILFEASISFHVRYGLKLTILNIDPAYTIGELAMKRKEVLEQLASEGLKDRNKKLEFPIAPRVIGIISSATAAGYEDLVAHLTHNPFGYTFCCKLYEAVMQGDKAEASIIRALNRCKAASAYLDVVVIVRGGGGTFDLHCFDSYEIARKISFLSIPVISGIGHERDVTVVDEVSSIRVKTPTAAADQIITRVKDFEDRVDISAYRLVRGTGKLTADLKGTFSLLTKNLESIIRNELLNTSHRLNVFMKALRYSVKFIQNQRERLRSRESNINHLTPRNILKRGYSITYKNGKTMKSSSEALEGDILKTVLYDGKLLSKVYPPLLSCSSPLLSCKSKNGGESKKGGAF